MLFFLPENEKIINISIIFMERSERGVVLPVRESACPVPHRTVGPNAARISSWPITGERGSKLSEEAIMPFLLLFPIFYA